MKSKQVSIRIPIHLIELLDEESVNTNENISHIINRHLKDYYEKTIDDACLNSRQKEIVTEVYFELSKVASDMDLHKSSKAKKIRKCCKQLWKLL